MQTPADPSWSHGSRHPSPPLDSGQGTLSAWSSAGTATCQDLHRRACRRGTPARTSDLTLTHGLLLYLFLI